MQASALLENCQTVPELRSSAYEDSALRRESKSTSLSLQEYGTCFHGFLLGLCLQGALALGLYGVYCISHIIR